MVWEIAHRGDSQNYNDNSKDAFASAMVKKFDMIELDIQISKDDIIFIHHDTMIDSKILQDLTMKEIKTVDSNILTLCEFLSMVNLNTMKIYLDIKGHDDRICKTLFNILKKYNYVNIYIASFNLQIIESLSSFSKIDHNYDHNYGIILENLFSKDLFMHLISKLKLKFICFHWTMLNHDIVDFLQQNGIKIFTYTCKTNNILNYMLKYDIDGIVTNYKLNLETNF